MKTIIEKKFLKKENGSIAVFVLVALLFMSAFLIIAYAGNINKSKDVKEQFDIVSGIYSQGDGDQSAYTRAYTALRAKNKQTLKLSSENNGSNNKSLELKKTYAGNLINYKIYGSEAGVGEEVKDTSDPNNGKYKISITVTNESQTQTHTADIFIDEQLKYTDGTADYIDFSNQEIVKGNGTKQKVTLPEIPIFEDYTKIEILTSITPSKIEVEYTGYTL